MEKRTLIELKTNELKGFKEEKEKLITTCYEMIQYYKSNMQDIQKQIKDKEEIIKNEILAMIEDEEYKETKTQLSYSTVSVKLIKRKPTQTIEKDDTALIEWLKNNNNEFINVETKEKIDWLNFKKELQIVGNSIINSDGQIVEGCIIKEIPEKVDLKLL